MEREEELEVLKSIYDDRLTIINELEYKIKISSNNVIGDLNITLGIQYPFGDIPIKYSFVANGGSNRIKDNVELRRVVNEEIERGIGDVVIFNLICCLEEFIMNKKNISSIVINDSSNICDDERNGESNEGRQNALKKEKIFVDIPLTMEGGPVNKESYDKWWIEFSSTNFVKKDLSTTRLTGRQMFEQNKQIGSAILEEDEEDIVIELDQLRVEEGEEEEKEIY